MRALIAKMEYKQNSNKISVLDLLTTDDGIEHMFIHDPCFMEIVTEWFYTKSAPASDSDALIYGLSGHAWHYVDGHSDSLAEELWAE